MLGLRSPDVHEAARQAAEAMRASTGSDARAAAGAAAPPADEPRFDDAAGTGEIACLVRDAELLAALADALPEARLLPARSAAGLADLLLARPCAVLVVELAVAGEAAPALLDLLAEQFPDLPLVAIGAADDLPRVAPRLARGDVHRFLQLPLSRGRARTFLRAALRRHAELRVAGSAVAAPARGLAHWRGSPVARLVGGALLAGATLFALAGAWRAGPDESPAAAPRAEALGPFEALFEAALAAEARDELVAPLGRSAVELYHRALAEQPGETRALAGLARVGGALLAEAESARAAGRYAEAETSARAAGLAGVAHETVAALLARIDDARAAARGPARSPPAEARRASAGGPTQLPLATAAAAPRGSLAGDASLASASTPAAAAAATADAVSTTLVPARTSELRGAPEAPDPTAATPRENGVSLLPGARALLPAGGMPAAAMPAGSAHVTALRKRTDATPAYPASARARGVEGWVDLEFTVGTAGVPGPIRVLAAEPAGVFERAAREAVERWRYEPLPEPQRASVRVRFQLTE